MADPLQGMPTWMREVDRRLGNGAMVEAITGQPREVDVGQSRQGQWAQGVQEDPAQPAQQPAEQAAQPGAQVQRPTGVLGEVYDEHKKATADLRLQPTDTVREELKVFVAHYEANKERYEKIAKDANVPAALIAALHYRESTGDFDTYLHQGDPLGKKAVHVPKDIPVFHEFDEAALHALEMKQSIEDQTGLTKDTRDPAVVATYAEAYNGLGYHNRDVPSPYVYSGTEEYRSGKYVSDGNYSSRTKDEQPGVIAMMGSVGALDGLKYDPSKPTPARTPDEAWQRLVNTKRTLARGAGGEAVTRLQELLKAAGQELSVDGDFGPGTERALRAWQRKNNLPVTGEVDEATRAGLDAARPKPQQGPRQGEQRPVASAG